MGDNVRNSSRRQAVGGSILFDKSAKAELHKRDRHKANGKEGTTWMDGSAQWVNVSATPSLNALVFHCNGTKHFRPSSFLVGAFDNIRLAKTAYTHICICMGNHLGRNTCIFED